MYQTLDLAQEGRMNADNQLNRPRQSFEEIEAEQDYKRNLINRTFPVPPIERYIMQEAYEHDDYQVPKQKRNIKPYAANPDGNNNPWSSIPWWILGILLFFPVMMILTVILLLILVFRKRY